MPVRLWGHGLSHPERLDPIVRDEFEKLIGSLTPFLGMFGLREDYADAATRNHGPTIVALNPFEVRPDFNRIAATGGYQANDSRAYDPIRIYDDANREVQTVQRSGILDIQTDVFSFNNTTTETDVYTYTLAPRTLISGVALRSAMHADILVNDVGVGGPNIALEISLGGTNIVSGNIYTGLGDTASVRGFWCDVYITAVGIAAQRAIVIIEPFDNNGLAIQTWGGLGATPGPRVAHHNSLALDETTDLTLRWAVTFSTASANHEFRRRLAFVERLRA